MRNFLAAATLVWLYTIPIHAQETSALGANTVTVEWYNPEVLRSVKKNRARVRLSGQTAPGAKVKISGNTVPFITKKGKVVPLPVQRVWPANIAQADDRGAFEMHMDLPFATAQLPFEVTTPAGQTKNYQISLLVDRNDVKLSGQAKVKNSPYSRRKWGVWGGLGYNFLKYDQSIPEISANVNFKSFAGPALYAKLVHNFSRDWAFQGTINQSPGKTASSDQVQVTQGSYDWTFLAGEFTYFPPKWKVPTKRFFNEFGLQAGLQHHIVPFVARSSTTDANTTGVETNSLTMMAAGFTWLVHYDRYWLFESFLRYQYPLASGDLFKIEPKFAFDGSVGIVHKWKPNWRLGAFWYGQWHKYDFKDAPDTFSGNKVSGDQSLFFSDLEFRIGYEFD